MTDTKGLTGSDIVSDASRQAPDRTEADGRRSPAPRQRRVTRLGSAHAGLIAAAVVLVLLLVFILENAHSVNVGFLGAHLRLPLAVALLLAGVGGALLVGAVGAARITQLRRAVRREIHRSDQPS
jgi:uncharacterized integral membrane protein